MRPHILGAKLKPPKASTCKISSIAANVVSYAKKKFKHEWTLTYSES